MSKHRKKFKSNSFRYSRLWDSWFEFWMKQGRMGRDGRLKPSDRARAQP